MSPTMASTRGEQRASALVTANDVRTARAGWKRETRQLPEVNALAGAVGMVLDPPEWAATWRVAEMLDVVPRIGPHQVKRAHRACGVSEGWRLGQLTSRQREALYHWLSDRLQIRSVAA